MIDQTVFNNKKAAYYTLGCKLNFAETSTIGKLLAEQGVRKVRPGEKADICVVNTSDPSDQQATPRCLYRGDRLLRTVEAGGSLPYRRRGLGSWRRTEIRDPSISGEPGEERTRRNCYRLTKQGYTFLLPFLLGR